MVRRAFLAFGAIGLVAALALSVSLLFRQAPRLSELTQITGTLAATGWSVTGTVITIRPGPTATETIAAGWCAYTVGALVAGDSIAVWTDRNVFGRARAWRIQRGSAPLCRYADSVTALTAGNRRVRGIALLAGAAGLISFAAVLIDARWFRTG